MFTTVRYFIKTSVVFLFRWNINRIIYVIFQIYIAVRLFTGVNFSSYSYYSCRLSYDDDYGRCTLVFPRAEKVDKKYNPDLILIVYWLMTSSTGLRFIFQVVEAYNYIPWVNTLILVFSSLQVASLILFFYSIWGRIRPVGSQYREAKGEKF